MKNVIYKISNNVNDKIYIGSAVCFKKRYAQHKHHLLKNTHHNILLQNHVNKYGFDSIKFEILENVLGNDLIIREQFYIDTLNPYFNIRRIAESMKGTKRNDEQKIYMVKQRNLKSPYKKGWNHTQESKDKISKIHKGKKLSEEHILKFCKSNIGKKMKEDIKLKISKKLTGRLFSNETKSKLSEQKKGPLNPMFGKMGSEHHNFGKRWIAKTTKTPKRIIDTNTGTVYPSIKDASVFLGIPRSTLNKYVLGYNEKITNFKYHD